MGHRLLLLACAAVSASAQNVKIEGAPRHPTVFLVRQDIERARRNVERYAWARQIAAAVRKQADFWMAKDDAWLRKAVPPPAAAFAYGLTGCPVCGGNYGPWARDAASFDNPLHVRCPRGHVMPDREHPDAGTGYVAPDGRIHYFVGAYNAWAVEQLTFGALENLVYAYTLTGDEHYAAKAAVVLDAIAAIYPTCHKGQWDYPSNPPSGRLDRPWYQASRVLIHYVDHYDQLFNSKSLDAPSVTPGLSRRQNIERNLLLDGGDYCYRESQPGGLHNGEADYERGALAVGVCLGIPEYVRWAVDGPFGIRVLLANDIARDGSYYEITPMYADHTRELYFTFAEPLLNYRGSAYPEGLDLYRHPKLRLFFEPHNLPLNAAGIMPRYGDAPPNLTHRDAPPLPFDRSDYDFLEKLYARSADAAEKRQAGTLLGWLAGGRFDFLRGLASTGDASGTTIPDRRVSAGISIYREPGDRLGGGFTERMWMLFHAGDPPEATATVDPHWRRRLLESDFLGQKGFAELRSGSQGVTLRYGPSLNHGHFDGLHYNYIARGYELTYDIGYGYTAATQTQSGWAKQTASHNVVVVDEKSQMEAGDTGGSLHLFADLPSLKLVEASAEPNYKAAGVSVYRRTLALIGGGDDAYLVDLFRVRGGRQHDWMYHALSPRARIAGAGLGPEEPGSLAGAGIGWGKRQLNDGDMPGHPNAPYWMPPPGNGYGFIEHPGRGSAEGPWSVDWDLDRTTHLRVAMAEQPGTEVILAVAPGLYPNYPKARFVVARRRGEALASEFAAAVEPYAFSPEIERVQRLRIAAGSGEVTPLAVKVLRRDGVEDYIFSAADDAPHSAEGVAFAGRFAHARVRRGKLVSLEIVGGREFQGFGRRVSPAVAAWTGAVAAVDAAASTVRTAAALPLDGSLDGQPIVFGSARYSHTSPYRIARIEAAAGGRVIHLEEPIVLGEGRVESVAGPQALTSLVPHDYARSLSRNGDTGFFRGKRIRSAGGATARVSGIRYGRPMTLTVDASAGFRPGDVFYYDDLQPGDEFEILSTVAIQDGRRIGGNVRAAVAGW